MGRLKQSLIDNEEYQQQLDAEFQQYHQGPDDCEDDYEDDEAWLDERLNEVITVTITPLDVIYVRDAEHLEQIFAQYKKEDEDV